MSPEDWKNLLDALAEPFPESAIEWRAGSTTKDKKKAQALPYAESRAYEDRLNKLVGGEWGCHFKPWGEGRIICELTIHGTTRSSSGEENDGFAPGTASEAQAFKRACSKFGLGRYLYDLPAPWVAYDAEKRKLLETPKVPQRFLPQAKPQTLSKARADAMLLELEGLGFDIRDAHELAKKVLSKKIVVFESLTEAEALEVWNAAKKAVELPKAEPKKEGLPDFEPNPRKAEPWQRWQTPEDAMLWGSEQTGEDGEPIFNAYSHTKNAYDKAKREYANSLPSDDKGNAKDMWHYWWQQCQSRMIGGETFVLPTYGTQELFEPKTTAKGMQGAKFNDGENVSFADLGN